MGLVKNNTDLEEIRESILNLEEISQEIKTAIGNTADAGGTTESGSTMAKMNAALKIVSKLGIDENGLYVITD